MDFLKIQKLIVFIVINFIDPSFKEGCARLTTVLFKPLSDQ